MRRRPGSHRLGQKQLSCGCEGIRSMGRNGVAVFKKRPDRLSCSGTAPVWARPDESHCKKLLDNARRGIRQS